MSEESKITSVEKVKDPRRVEAGKRLGMISKQAKEKKLAQMREQEVERNEAGVSGTSDWFSNALVSSPVVGVGIAGLVGLALLFGYINPPFGYNKKYKSSTSDVKDGSKTQNSNPENKANPKRVYKELDTLD